MKIPKRQRRRVVRWMLKDDARRRTREWWEGGKLVMSVPADTIEVEGCLWAQILPWGVFFKAKTGTVRF